MNPISRWLVTATCLVGADLGAGGAGHFPSDPQFRYPNFDELTAQADEAGLGLTAGAELVAGGIASGLH